MTGNNLNLAIPVGTIYGLLRPNTAGKSTTIHMLIGRLRSTSGIIKIFGEIMPDQLKYGIQDIDYFP